MRTIYHLWLSPEARAVRMALAEKGLEFDLKLEKVWDRRLDFLAMNPAGDVPVLVEPDGTTVAGSHVIYEYLEEIYPEPTLLPGSALDRAEVRRLVMWFEGKFGREVTENLVGEKVMKRFMKMGEPFMPAIRAGLDNIHYHLDYISYLNERRRFLAGDTFSLADIVAACQVSVIDYIGDIPWDLHPGAKDWYARIKSRPSMKAVLADVIPGLAPPAHYADLDF
jgi:glutathione S-transferase